MMPIDWRYLGRFVERRLLQVEAAGLTAYRWRGGQLQVEAEFAADQAGFDAFAAYLAGQPASLYYLLADAADEVLRRESLPHARGRDRAAMLARKLEQHFPGSSLHLVWSLGRESGGRRDEKFVFAALTRPNVLEPWLAVLRRQASRLVGLYSAALRADHFAAACLDQGARLPRRLLLVTPTRAGLRQAFLEDGRLIFSRLTPLSNAAPAEVAHACASEASRLRQYLLGQRYLERDTPLPVWVPVPAAEADVFRAACPDTSDLQFAFPDLVAIADRLGIERNGSAAADPLFRQLLMRHVPSRQFAPSSERRNFRFWQTGLALNGIALLLLSGILTLAAWQLEEARDLDEQSASLRQQAARAAQQVAAASQAMPAVAIERKALHAVLTRFDQFEKTSRQPTTLYRHISAALDLAPQVELERIDWHINDTAAGAKDGRSVNIDVEIQARLSPISGGDASALQGSRDDFVAGLGKDGTLQVGAVRYSSAFDSSKTLRSDPLDQAVEDGGRFSVHLVQSL